MRLYIYLGMNIPLKDYNQIIFAIRIIATGWGYNKEKFEDIKYFILRRKGFYRERKSCLMVFDCRNSKFKVMYDPAYEQNLLGHQKAFVWYSDNGGQWQSISPEDKKRFIIEGQRTYIDF